MTRDELTAAIRIAKRKKGLSWAAIAEAVGDGAPVYITAAMLGQMTLTPAQAEKAVALLDLPAEAADLLVEVPYRGSLPTAIPTDPLIYRFYEITQVYGMTIKELIQEEFGDGIMSAIDFDLAIERQPDPKGDRVKVTMSGKFLNFKHF